MIATTRALLMVLKISLASLACAESAAQNAGMQDQRKFLIIYSDSSVLTANVDIGVGIRHVIVEKLSPYLDVYAEYRDTKRLPGEAEDQRFIEELERKYDDLAFDVLITVGPAALALAGKYKERIAPGAVVVFTGVTQSSLATAQVPNNFSGVLGSFDLSRTIELARQVQPSAKRVVVFSGSEPFDTSWQHAARDTLQGMDLSGFELELISGLNLEGFIETAEALDEDTILLILTIFEDAEGDRFIPHEAAGAIAARSAAPSWGVYNTFIGNGVVGGHVETFEAMGQTSARLAIDLLDNSVPAGTRVATPSQPIVDWLQLKRYGLSEDRLPATTALINYAPSAWQRYRTELSVLLGVLVAQSAMIAALVVLGRRWRAAEREVAERRFELAQISRVSQLGELSGAITHELNQPLTAILANAEAGSILLGKSPPDLEEIGNILTDIVADDTRAANILASLSRLMRHKEIRPEPIDLNEVTKTVETLVRSELVMRGVRLVLRMAGGPLTVSGDKEQFQQVLLNLLLNAADAVSGLPPGKRTVVVETEEREDGWRQIVVEDSGQGLAPELNGDPFRAFVTTKDNGMGIGLSVCRNIAEAHNGTLVFEEVEEGARIVFSLPPA